MNFLANHYFEVNGTAREGGGRWAVEAGAGGPRGAQRELLGDGEPPLGGRQGLPGDLDGPWRPTTVGQKKRKIPGFRVWELLCPSCVQNLEKRREECGNERIFDQKK